MSSKKKKILFSDDEDNSEELKANFEKALNKKQFVGEKGKMLLELQNTYNTDSRFRIDKKFKDDISIKKLPSSVKAQLYTKAKDSKEYSYDNKEPEIKDEEILQEKNKNLSILSSVLPNSAYLDHKKKEVSVKHYMIKRFDPLLNLGESAVNPIKVEEANKEKKEDNKIKLEKGVKVFNEPLLNPIYENKHQKEMKKREKEKLLNKAINEINDNMNGEVIINYERWKNSIKDSKQESFNLFGDSEEPKKDEKKEEEKEEVKKEKVSVQKEENEKDEKQLLKQKRKREKQKDKMKKQKEKEKEKKQKQRENEEKIAMEYKNDLQERYGEEKANNYFKYIEMIREKSKKGKVNKH